MAYPEDTNGVIVRTVPRSPAVPPGTVTASDWADHESRLATLEGGYDVGDLNDVDETGAAAGKALLRNPANTGYILGSAAGSLATVSQDGVVSDSDVTDLNLTGGLTVIPGSPGGGVNVTPTYGGTGSQDLIARSDHYHTTQSTSRTTTAASGYLSSGSRSLGSLNVTLLSGITYLVEGVLTGQMRGADVGTAYYRLTVTVNGNARQSPAGSAGYWCVQGVPDKYRWDHEQTIVGTGATVTVSAAVDYYSGAGFNVDYSELKVLLRPRR